MNINGSVTILFERDGMTIKVHDEDASIEFLEIRLNQEQTCQALGRLGNTECESMTVRALHRVGKKMEHESFDFPMPCSLFDSRCKEIAVAECKRVCPEGWEPDTHFGSQNSFFKKDDKPWARTTIRRWVPRADDTAKAGEA